MDALSTITQTLFPFEHVLSNSLVLIILFGVFALLIAVIFRMLISLRSVGTKKMEIIAQQIRKGTMVFLRREYVVISLFALLVAALLYTFFDAGLSNVNAGRAMPPYTALSFIIGALCSVLAGFIGVRTETAANVRTTQAARTGLSEAFKVTFLSGSIMGLSVVGLGLIGLCEIVLYMLEYAEMGLATSVHTLVGFIFGASSVALFTRVGGGIFANAIDIGGDFVRKSEAGILENDPRNPATIASSIGDTVGNGMGMGADFFESFVGSLVAAMLIGLTGPWGINPESAILLPLFIAGLGIVASVIGTFIVRLKPGSKDVHSALKSGSLLTFLLVIVGSFFFCKALISAALYLGVFFALVSGLIVGVVIKILTEHHTSIRSEPVKSIANATKSGAATTLLNGLAQGYLSTFLSVLFIAVAVLVAYFSVGLYGIAISAVGMLSTLSMTIAVSGYGSVSSSANRITELSGLPKTVKARTDVLDAAGSTSTAIGKGFAIGSAALTALALIAVFSGTASLESINIMNPLTLAGFLVGGALPFVFCGITIHGIERVVSFVIEEARRQLKEIKGLKQGTVEPNTTRFVNTVAGAALYEVMLLVFLAVASPIIVGFVLGSEALGGLLIGSLVSGVALAISMTNSGGALDNAKRFIEAGNFGGKESDSYNASILGVSVGDSLKDTAGPSINILIKLMAIVSVLTVGLYSAQGLLG